MRTHTVIVHGIDGARLALTASAERGDKVVLLSAEGAALYAGPAWFRELRILLEAEFPEVIADAILDCGNAPGAALAALRCGVKTISLDATPAVLAKISAIADQHGARLVERPAEPALDMATQSNPEAAIAHWFAKEEL